MANETNGVNLGLELELWQAVDAMRSNMDAAEYKHVVHGLIFLQHISDAFEEQAPGWRQSALGETRKTRTSTGLSVASGCRKRRAGPCCRPTPNSPPSAR